MQYNEHSTVQSAQFPMPKIVLCFTQYTVHDYQCAYYCTQCNAQHSPAHIAAYIDWKERIAHCSEEHTVQSNCIAQSTLNGCAQCTLSVHTRRTKRFSNTLNPALYPTEYCIALCSAEPGLILNFNKTTLSSNSCSSWIKGRSCIKQLNNKSLCIALACICFTLDLRLNFCVHCIVMFVLYCMVSYCYFWVILLPFHPFASLLSI